MSFKFLPKSKRVDFLSSLLNEGLELDAPVKKEDNFYSFKSIKDPNDVVFDYVRTILPPKKFLFPQEETIVKYDYLNAEANGFVESKERIIFGVHPCDLKGISLLDKVFSEKNVDSNYMEKRKRAILVGIDCTPDDRCFCTSVGTVIPKNEFFDLFLTDIGDGYLINASTDRGKELLKVDFIRDATDGEIQRRDEFVEKKKATCTNKMDLPLSELPLMFAGVYNSKVWEENGEKCVACGRCNLVCPTCYCFNVYDSMNLKLTEGERIRQWDSCHLESFTKVATGEVFRKSKANRDRHRFYRKFYYLSRFSPSFCTGCGRCGKECLADIEIVETVNRLAKEYNGITSKV